MELHRVFLVRIVVREMAWVAGLGIHISFLIYV